MSNYNPAQSFNILSYANTWGDMMVTTNSLVNQNNDLASNNFYKSAGTLYLNDNTLGLQVANNANFGGQLRVQGIGSSAYIQNNLRVDTQVYFTNTSLGLTNSGQANIGGPLLALGSGTGLTVSNNAVINGTLNVNGVTTANGIVNINNALNVTGNTNITNSAYITGRVQIGDSLSVANYGIVGTNFSVGGTTYTDYLQSNTRISGTTLTITGTTYTNVLIANSSITTQNATVTNTLNVNKISATSINVETVSANTNVTTPKLVVSSVVEGYTAQAYFNTLQTIGQVTVGGNFVINGQTVYNSNNLTINTGSAYGSNSSFVINRGLSGANATFRWNESAKLFDVLNVNTGLYYNIITGEQLSGSVTSTSTSNVATSAAANTLNNNIISANNWLKSYTDSSNTQLKSYTDGAILTSVSSANTQLKAYTDDAIISANTQLKSYVDSANTQLKTYTDGAINSANTQLKSYVDGRYANATNLSSGTVPTARLATGTASSTTYLRGDQTWSPIPAATTLTNDITSSITLYPLLSLTNSGTLSTANTSSTKLTYVPSTGTLAATAFSGSGSGLTSIPNSALINSSITINGTSIALGDAGSIVAGATITDDNSSNSTRYIMLSPSTSGSYTVANTSSNKLTYNPSTGTLTATTFSGSGASLSGLTAGNLTGTIPSTVLGNSTLYVGNTAIALNRSSGTQSLTGVTIDASQVTGSASLSSITISGQANVSSISATGQTLSTKGYREGVVNLGTVNGSTSLDLSQGNIFNVTLGSAGIAFTFTNPPPSGTACYITVVLTQGSGGSKTYGSFTNSRWTDSVTPVLTTTAGKTDILMFFTVDGGTNYYGSFTGANFG